MESIFPKATYGGIKRYLRRQRYRRIHGGGGTTGRRKMEIIRLRSPRRKWRMRTSSLRLMWVMRSPLKMLKKLKNAYINLMLRLAAGNVHIGAMKSDNIFGVKRIPESRKVSKLYSSDAAFEARLMFEISKTLVASHELYPL